MRCPAGKVMNNKRKSHEVWGLGFRAQIPLVPSAKPAAHKFMNPERLKCWSHKAFTSLRTSRLPQRLYEEVVSGVA